VTLRQALSELNEFWSELKLCKLYASCPIGGVIVSHPAYEHIVNITNKSETEGLSTITSSDQNSFSSDKACRKVTDSGILITSLVSSYSSNK
jgi:hypothetical protein